MTAYLETASVAHVLELREEDSDRAWRALCFNRYNPARQVAVSLPWPDMDKPWPVRFTYDGQPRRPWCKRCVWVIRFRVRDYQRDVLDHAGRPS